MCVHLFSLKGDGTPSYSEEEKEYGNRNIIRMHAPFPNPIYRDTTCVLRKGDKIIWYQIYQEFTKPNFLEYLPSQQVYVHVKRSKLHYVGAHPPIFLCANIIEWILQKVNSRMWVILYHLGKKFTNLN